jgi:hypothetical protein
VVELLRGRYCPFCNSLDPSIRSTLLAPRKRKPKYAAVAGVAGAGVVPIKTATAAISKFIEKVDGEILWVLPHTSDISGSLTKVKDFLWNEDASYALISDGSLEDEEWEQYAKTIVEVDADVYSALVTEVSGYDVDDLSVIFLLDEELESDIDLVEAASEEELTCYDLKAGMSKLVFGEVEDEDEPEDDDEPAESDDDALQLLEVPTDVQTLIESGKLEKAAEKLKDSVSREKLNSLAEEHGVEVKKGTWAATIAKGIVDALAGGDEPEDEPDDEPEDEHRPAKKATAKKATAKKSTRKAKDPEPEPEDDDEPEAEVDVEPEVVAETGSLNSVFTGRDEIALRVEHLQAVAHVAGMKGTTEAKKFSDLAREILFG